VTRLADFLAQTANETGGYTRFEENLNYSAEALIRTWPTRFTKANVALYARKPELIAAKAYGDRMGNRTPEEGWLFRGRGMLQLTGRANYEATDRRLGIGLDVDPEVAAVPALSLLIACDFYKANGVLGALDAENADKARQITNGGTIGLKEVNTLRAKILQVLA
jgi:putative chitinase